MGELLRCYWQPVVLSEELPAGAPPKPLKILGKNHQPFEEAQE